MQISFFEEFPTKENLRKIQYVSFPTKVYVGAYSFREYNSISFPENVEKVYWPLLKKEEGYCFSPFSKYQAVKRVLGEIKDKNTPLMIDAELPTHPNPLLYLTEFHSFFHTRKYIRSFISQRKKIYTAEYFPSSHFSEKVFYHLGLSFQTKHHYPIKMIYSSMHDFGETILRREIKQAQKRYGKRLRIGLGTLTHGILGTEPTISVNLLERDLKICQEFGIEEVILFRLGGMNQKYQRIIENLS